MAGGSASTDLLNQLGVLAAAGATGDLSDAQLLRRFLGGSGAASQAALTVLVDRHGPMVLRACRHVLGDSHDAQDAFQATFLVLARKAGSVRNADSVAGWLHGVALRVALRSKADAGRRRALERRMATLKAIPLDDPKAGPESWPELHEEVARLPSRYREPVVLCYLEGLSTEAAALRIGCPRGTVLSRLSRARDRLRGRLIRRGIVPPAILLSLGLTDRAMALPTSLIRATVGTSLGFASRRASVASLATAPASDLARKVLLAMTISKLKMIGSGALACLLLMGGVHAVARRPAAIAGPGLVAPGGDVNLVQDDGPDEAARKRRADALKRLKIEVETLGGFVDDAGTTVGLERTSTTDADLGRIAALLRELPQVRRLYLSDSLITDTGLAHLRDLAQLNRLFLKNTDITDAGLAHLRGLTDLVTLLLEDTGVGDEGMKVLAGMPRLGGLSLGNTRVGDEGLRHLGGLVRLEELTLEETPITDAGLAHLKGLIGLRVLHLDNTRISDAGLASIKGFVNLERLHLCDTDVTDAGLVNLEAMKDLYYLMLHNTWDTSTGKIRDTVKVSDAGLVHLRGLKSLHPGSLFLWDTAVTEAGAASLKEALPNLDRIAIGKKGIVGFQKGHRPRGKQ